MTCANHPEAAAAAYCRTCGKPLCTECIREAEGTIFCVDHVPVVYSPDTAPNPAGAPPPYTAPVSGTAAGTNFQTSAGVPSASPYTAPVNPGGPVPALAFILGFIPGVGAIYNGQYAKGLIHAVIFGILVSIISGREFEGGRHSGMEPLIGILIGAWVFYMAFEAYHTAKNRRDGTRAEESSSLLQLDRASGRFPVGALVLIGIGGLLLLDTTNLISINRLFHLWPVGLILIGAYMLYERMSVTTRTTTEAPDDRRS